MINNPRFAQFNTFGQNFSKILDEFGACAFFRGFYEVRTSQLEACCKNFIFLRGAYIAAYKIYENSDEISEFPSDLMDFPQKIIFDICCENPINFTVSAEFVHRTRPPKFLPSSHQICEPCFSPTKYNIHSKYFPKKVLSLKFCNF